MTRISYRFEPSSATCPACSAAMVVRIQVAERDAGPAEERWRREECSGDRSHSAAPAPAA